MKTIMRPALLILVALLLNCQTEPNVVTKPTSAERTEAAHIFANGLAYDGCEEMIRLDADSLLNKFTGYKPSPSTLPLVQQALKDIPPSSGQLGRAVTVRFFETGQQVKLECGWGSRPEVPEIEVLEIKKR